MPPCYAPAVASQRLQKIIAQAGITSRRNAERLIVDGRVRVNGAVQRKLGTLADLRTCRIDIEGLGAVRSPEPPVYILLHKPPYVVSTMADPEGRTTVMDVVRGGRAEGPRQYEGELPRVFIVGRLDFDAEGLVLLTNDGPLANSLLHPRCHVPKTYTVKVRGRIGDDALVRLREGGLRLNGDGAKVSAMTTRPAEARVVKYGPANSWIELTLFEGRYHQVKRMCDAVGHSCIRLVRTEFAGLELGSLPTGGWRFLSGSEETVLRKWTARSA